MTMITNLDLFGRSSSVGHPVIEERCVSFHKCHREALEEVLDGGLLFFAIVESIGSAELGLAWIRLARNMKFRAREIYVTHWVALTSFAPHFEDEIASLKKRPFFAGF